MNPSRKYNRNKTACKASDSNLTSQFFTTYDAEGNIVSREDMPLVTETADNILATETSENTEQNIILSPSVNSVSSVANTSAFSEADLWLQEAELLYDDGGMMLMSAPSGPDAASEVFAYDHLGNRYQETSKNGTVFTYFHNAVNQYSKRQGSVLGLEYDEYYSHDDNGNLEIDKDGNIYLYDHRNRLVSIGDGETTNSEYVYDALGRRISKTADGTIMYFYYDTDNRVIAQYIQEQSQNVQPDRTFVYGNGITEVLAMFLYEKPYSQDDVDLLFGFFDCWLTSTGNPDYNDDYDYVNDNKIDLKDWAVLANHSWNLPDPASHETRYYYLTDALGSVRGLIGGRLNQESDRKFYNYDVYGTSPDSSGVDNPFRFAGYRYDSETGHYHLWTRTYDSVTGRPLQMDRDYYDSMNLYEYCLSNPMNFIDPWGLACHIWVYFNDITNPDRKKAGDLFLYGPKGEPLYYAPARGMGREKYKDDNDRTKPNRNTPLDDYVGKIEPPQRDVDSYGSNKVVRLTGQGEYLLQPQLQGELEDRRKVDDSYGGRDGLLIHGGRKDRAISKKGTTWDVQDGKFVKSPNSNFKCPMGTSGCIRLTDDNQKGLTDTLEKYCKCEEIIVHVSPNATPADPTPLPEWTDPRVPQGNNTNSEKPNPN